MRTESKNNEEGGTVIKLTYKGELKKTTKFLQKFFEKLYLGILDKYGREGVQALSSATPIRTGETAASWYYEIIQNESGFSIVWKNSHINKGVNIAIILQYGHGTRNGGYVEGRDYINPALQPVFERMANSLWKEVTSE